MSRVSFHTRPYDRLEPYDGKLSRTVLRGGTGSNASLLPDIRSEKDILKLVNALILNTKGEGEKSSEDFWVKAERLYYSALIGYIWYEAEPEVTYVLDKSRLSIRLVPPYSEERKAAASAYAKKHGFQVVGAEEKIA